MGDTGYNSRDSSVGKVHTINSFGMGRLHGKNAVVTGAAGSVENLQLLFGVLSDSLHMFKIAKCRFIHVKFVLGYLFPIISHVTSRSAPS